ncbi:MAG: hypothetical protein WCS43_07610 [Verrucomicrobiota bacterium]
MELYISRAGSVEGPLPIEKVRKMLQQGQLSPTDLGAPVGATDWSPLSELLGISSTPMTGAGTPPPIPAEPDMSHLDQQFLMDGKIISGTHGKSVRQILDEVASGGRFVVFQYVFSLIIMSFRRNSPIMYLAPGQSGTGAAFGWSLIPLCFGWWGIPWGIIYSIGALWRNSAGGVDITEPIMAQLVGPQVADAMIRNRPKHKTGALWGLRALFLSPLVLFPLMIMMAVNAGSRNEQARAKQPGYTPFKQAERFVGRWEGVEGRGNTPKATEAAVNFSKVLEGYRALAISENKTKKTQKDKDHFITWCEVQGDRCLFIVHVPDLRRFKDDAKTAIAEGAWFAAQVSSEKIGLPANTKLAVAVRGDILYDRFITGSCIVDSDSEESLKKSISTTKKGSSVDEDLMRYFVTSPN